MSFNGRTISASRILSMSETFQPHQVAATLDIDEEHVLEVLYQAGKTNSVWTLRCNKTGRQWRTRSERGAYRMAHLIGLTDWDSYPGEPTVKPREKMPAGPERDALIVKMRQEGKSLTTIAKTIGMSSPGALKHLKRLGLANQ